MQVKGAAWLLGSLLVVLSLAAWLPSLVRATQAGEGFAFMQILQPSDGSKVIPPLAIWARRGGEDAARLWLELYGKDGRLLARRILRLTGQASGPGEIVERLDFEIPASGEAGWLRLVTQDSRLRLMAVDALPLTLFKEGRVKAAPQEAAQPDIVLRQPAAGAQVSGGVLEVSGEVNSRVRLPLRVQLVDEAGRVVGQRLAGSGPAGETTFTAQVPYSVRAATPVRLLVFEEGSDLRQIKHLSSLELVLKP
jgi:hypothetical protein